MRSKSVSLLLSILLNATAGCIAHQKATTSEAHTFK
ncbi:hypothetical protein Mpal_2789 [Methanosphaerula palustris E1-9c]|uniref:Lipoprotein n=1 Tax=Methanosphaerula palustris (strain ATCC BAA-1556 / DSM 19958 / E1-9c) TaxID=521011 RepID=B8GGC6_METPE|nr:hypothetical protein Mpal_2789 [Methanosphaerula palustris E1-9c]